MQMFRETFLVGLTPELRQALERSGKLHGSALVSSDEYRAEPIDLEGFGQRLHRARTTRGWSMADLRRASGDAPVSVVSRFANALTDRAERHPTAGRAGARMSDAG